jgi:hypothetical protein
MAKVHGRKAVTYYAVPRWDNVWHVFKGCLFRRLTEFNVWIDEPYKIVYDTPEPPIEGKQCPK